MIINLILAILNAYLGKINSDSGNKKTSAFNWFACGFCACVVVSKLLKN